MSSGEHDLDVRPDWLKAVKDVLLSEVTTFAESEKCCRVVFVTGSYAADPVKWIGKCSLNKNINLYFISQTSAAQSLRIKVSAHFSGIRDRLNALGIDLLIDCHPYLVAPFAPTRSARLQITTKVLDYKYRLERYSLPPSIGTGWLRSYHVLFGDPADLRYLEPAATSEPEWIATLHEALSRYKGVLDHLPFACPNSTAFGLEAGKYGEESIKDLISVACEFKELTAGKQLDLLADWQCSAKGFLVSRLGREAELVFDRAVNLKRVTDTSEVWSNDLAHEAYDDANLIWRYVWQEFQRRHKAIISSMPWLMRVNAFV